MDQKVVIGLTALVTSVLVAGGAFVLTRDDDPGFPGGRSPGGSSAQGDAATVASNHCSIPTVTDGFIGFEVGKPDGWTMNAAGGAVIVRKDPAGAEMALVYPVVLGDASMGDLFEGYSAVLSNTAEAQGGHLSLEVTSDDADSISGEVGGNFAGKDVAGEFTVSPLEDQTVFSVYWAPVRVFEKERQTLDQIISCYSKRVGTPLKRFQGNYFAASIPSDWEMIGETGNGIDLSSGSRDAGVSYAYVGNVPGIGDARTFMQYAVANLIPLHNTQIVADQHLGTTTDQLGISWEVLASEFDAIYEGKDVHGIITTTIADAGYGAYTGIFVIRLADAGKWDHYANLLAAIQESIVITRTQTPGQGLTLSSSDPSDPVTSSSGYSDTGEDDNFEGWSEAMLGFETVQSPSTGDLYDVPLNSWDPTEGGYVRPLPGGGTELLEDY